MIPERCPNCRLFWTQGDDSRPLRVIAIYDREPDAITHIKCPRCNQEYDRDKSTLGKPRLRAAEDKRLMRGIVMERTVAGDVRYPASAHHICGLTGLSLAPLGAATRIVSILDPSEPRPVELLGHDAKTLTLRFDDVVQRGGTYVAPERDHVEEVLAFDRGALAADRLVVHCHAGVSRSTAAFVALLAQRNPAAEAAVFAELRAIRPRAWPNSRIVAFADDLLGTNGALTRELREHRYLMAERYPELFYAANVSCQNEKNDDARS